MNQQAGFGERNYWSTKKKSIPGFELIDYETWNFIPPGLIVKTTFCVNSVLKQTGEFQSFSVQLSRHYGNTIWSVVSQIVY